MNFSGYVYKIINLNLLTTMNRNSYENFSVPSLSLASSRSKRAIPTKDINYDVGRSSEVSKKLEISRGIDRQSRPPIFSSRKLIDQPKRETVRTIDESKQSESSLTRNVYLMRQENMQNQQIPTFRTTNTISRISSIERLQRNPESAKQIVNEVKHIIETRKIDAKKSLFQRKMQKLFQQAHFYENELLGTFADEGLAQGITQLESYRSQALTLNHN